jgi:molybdenum cofactor guanylyltransferase
MAPLNDIEAVILAGGKSERMGTDKGLVHLHGKPMIAYSIDLLLSLKIPFRIGSHIEAYRQFGCEMLSDLLPGLGPMGGLYTALRTCSASRLLLLSCDSPFISEELISRLLKGSGQRNISVASSGEKLYPLCAIYPVTIFPHVQNCIESGNLRMKSLVECLPHRLVDMDELLAENPDMLLNFNTRSEIETYLQGISEIETYLQGISDVE